MAEIDVKVGLALSHGIQLYLKKEEKLCCLAPKYDPLTRYARQTCLVGILLNKPLVNLPFFSPV